MTVKTILTEPNKLLRQVSKPVDKVGEDGPESRIVELVDHLKSYIVDLPFNLRNSFRHEALVCGHCPLSPEIESVLEDLGQD